MIKGFFSVLSKQAGRKAAMSLMLVFSLITPVFADNDGQILDPSLAIVSPVITPAPTADPTPVPSPSATPLPTVNPSPIPSPTPSLSASPVPTATATPFPSPSATPVPTVSSTPVPTPPGGGGNGGGGDDSGNRGRFQGSTGNGRVTTPIISPEPTPNGRVLGAEVSCVGNGPYLKSYIKLGKKNDPNEVKKLQEFLNKYAGENLSVTGFYGRLTLGAVNRFQVENWEEILNPWVAYGLANPKAPTGYVYKTTLRAINMTVCPELQLQKPELP